MNLRKDYSNFTLHKKRYILKIFTIFVHWLCSSQKCGKTVPVLCSLQRIAVSRQANLDYSQRHRKTFIRNWNTTHLHPLLAPIRRTVRYARDKMYMKGVKGSFVICFQFPYTNIHHVAAVWRQVISFQLKHESSLFVSFFSHPSPCSPC